LHKTEEELLAEMKPKGRYNIRLAEKNGCRVEKVASTECMLDIFMGLLGETLERD
jgi:lipid II:glycine glycyltransferase (peptidoglycan interpeptide bridge formation enzyme)